MPDDLASTTGLAVPEPARRVRVMLPLPLPEPLDYRVPDELDPPAPGDLRRRQSGPAARSSAWCGTGTARPCRQSG